MPPNMIMLIRHGEKPLTPPPYGVNGDGEENSHSLTVRGWQRAGALVNFFCSPKVAGIATPTSIYASAVSPKTILVDGDDVAKSLRPQQTVTPLAQALKLNLVTTRSVGEEAELASDLREETGNVLVAWEHKHIPLIAEQLMGASAPQWPGDVFDAVWILTARDGAYTLAQVGQNVLPGDSFPVEASTT